jgi:beta-mannan synthase
VLLEQIPMFNEQEDVIHQIVDCCCSMDWPKSKLTVQVCDDSTCEQTQSFVADKVHEWKELGINIELCWRSKRQGFKAGALAEAMVNLPNQVEYIAVFDVDFAPHESFLKDTVPWLLHNPTIGFVQTRWEFANPETSLLTKVQQISLNFHVKVEQFARCALDSFFNNNVSSNSCVSRALALNKHLI